MAAAGPFASRRYEDRKEGARGGTIGSPAQGTAVFSRVLYQLSYLAAVSQSSRCVDSRSWPTWAHRWR
jgi:hypothetical protein